MNLKQYLTKAKKEKWAIGQFNFCTLEQLRGILAAAKELKSPVILGTSEGEVKYLGIKETVALVEISRNKYGISGAFLNLDHGKNPEIVKEAVDLGYSAVHFDGSGLLIKDNIKISKKLCEYAHKKGVLFEGEIGAVKGDSAIHKEKIIIDKSDLATPEDASRYLKETKADSLAVAIGNIHGIYPERKKINFDLLEKINNKAKAFLVLHGGSDIDKEDIRRAIKTGVAKININTELRALWRKALDEVMERNKAEVKPYKIMPYVEELIKDKVKEKINLFASNGKIS
ncbi:MAG: class II fructose-bisphosphate aldolase family protein [Candidatus Nealsonbacteria bacterium]|nr:class II fructose-bisphosphate aldolase family protein [Candidatus Nealsonbacteria bacterium]